MRPKPNTQSRESILVQLRRQSLPAPGLPELQSQQLTRFDDPLGQFNRMLESAGGSAQSVSGAGAIERALESIAEYRSARCVASLVPHLVKGNLEIDQRADPVALARLDWVIAKAEFSVAENGALWVDGRSLRHRAMLFTTQYLVLVVQQDQMVHNMHQAYERISRPLPSFGVFVSGPSKTADIEQSLVLGAHGCRSLQVFLVG